MRPAPPTPTIRARCARPLAAVAVAALTLATGSTGQPAGADDLIDRADAAVSLAERLSTPNSGYVLALPDDPRLVLQASVTELAAGLGIELPASEVTSQLSAVGDDASAGRVANLLSQALECDRRTKGHVERRSYDEAAGQDIRDCAATLWTAVSDLELALTGSSSGMLTDVDLWPVLRIDATGDDTTYLNDYLVIIDQGGNDVYDNNAGSNLVDVNYAPPGSTAEGRRGRGPATGCTRAIAGLEDGECAPSVGVLFDQDGDDRYGLRKAPVLDARCTADQVVSRIMTVGAGLTGVGILRDAGAGSDRYTGRTLSIGAGHVAGVGVVSDGGGMDLYTAVRNSQGYGLVGGLGVLRDLDGDDHYDFYIPEPLDPDAPDQTDGAGGVIDDQADGGGPGEGVCDRTPRFTQGTANVSPSSIGVLIDDSGDDKYRGGFQETFGFPVEQLETLEAGSLGFANNGGVGVFLDRTGRDNYVPYGLPKGFSPRVDGALLLPSCPSTTGDGGGVGAFTDMPMPDQEPTTCVHDPTDV